MTRKKAGWSDEPSGVGMEIMMDISEKLGRLAAGQEATTERLDEMAGVQRAQAETQREQAVLLVDLRGENATQHAETAARLKNLEREVKELKRERQEPPPTPPIPAPQPASARSWSDGLTFIQQWWPRLVVFGGIVAGVVIAVLDWFRKGGADP